MNLTYLQHRMDKIKDAIEALSNDTEDLFEVVESEGVEPDDITINNAVAEWVQNNLTEYIRAQQHRFSLGLDSAVSNVDMFNNFVDHIKSVTPETTY